MPFPDLGIAPRLGLKGAHPLWKPHLTVRQYDWRGPNGPLDK